MHQDIREIQEKVEKESVFVESLRSEIRPLLEQLPIIKEKADALYEQVVRNGEILDRIRSLITRVLEELKSTVDRTNFEILEKKVASLSN